MQTRASIQTNQTTLAMFVLFNKFRLATLPRRLLNKSQGELVVRIENLSLAMGHSPRVCGLCLPSRSSYPDGLNLIS